MKKQIPVTKLATPPKTVWAMTGGSGHDSIKIDCTETDGISFIGVYIAFTSVYKLPGLVVQALAQLEQYNGLRADVEVKK